MEITLDSIRADHPAIAEALRQEGFNAGLDAGAEAERNRIIAVQAQAAGLPGHEALVAALVADGKTTGAEAAVQILAAEKTKGRQHAAALRADAPAPVAHAASDDAGSLPAGAPIEEAAKAKWDADASLRTEFINFSTYLAYAKAHAAGSVKVLGANK
jgi:hypothetical protein